MSIILNKTSKRYYTNLFSWVVIAGMLLWVGGFGFMPFGSPFAKASALNSVKDTLSDSDLNVVSTHAISYTSLATLSAAGTILVTFDYENINDFDLTNLASADISVGGVITGYYNDSASCGGGSGEIYLSNIDTGTDVVTFTVCPTDQIVPGAATITFSNKIINYNAIGSSVIRIDHGTEVGETRVYIIDDVLMTASVDTYFTFTISPASAGIGINGETTLTFATSSATALAFGDIDPWVSKTLGQLLQVETNAGSGFVVTLQDNGTMVSANGADIDRFVDGAGTATPTSWATPSNTLDVEATYGHYGVTSDDTNLDTDTSGGGVNDFGAATAQYAGNLSSPRAVFAHTGPSDNITQTKGKALVGFKIQIGSLQEAATDYTTTLTYIATPTF